MEHFEFRVGWDSTPVLCPNACTWCAAAVACVSPVDAGASPQHVEVWVAVGPLW